MLKRLKRAVKGINRRQNGQVLIMVLIVLALGAIVLAPTLNHAASSIKHQQLIETDALELYAADAGVENAVWQIKNEQITTPNQLTVNDKQVVVEIVLEEDIETFLEGLLGEAGVHSDWTVITNMLAPGEYEITATWDPPPPGHDTKKINGVGAWLQGDYEYVIDSASGMTDDYPVFTFRTEPYKGGTAFIWEWTDANRPVFYIGDSKSLSFKFTPVNTPDFYFSWFVGGSVDVGVVHGAETFEIWKVTSTATSDDGTSTTIESYVSTSGEQLKILTYTIQ